MDENETTTEEETKVEETSQEETKAEETSEAKPEDKATLTDKPEAAPEPLTPESITLPEGFEADEPTLTEFVGIMNNEELTPASRAQALVDLQAKFFQQASEKVSEAIENQQREWQEEVKADKEIGGDKLEANLGAISKLIDEYGTPELREAFTYTGAGNNPHIIKFLARLAKPLSEGKPVTGDVPSASKTPADILFGSKE